MERMSFATEWDMCWFCDHCGKMVPWKKKGYKDGKFKLCYECSQLPAEERRRLYKSSHSKGGNLTMTNTRRSVATKPVETLEELVKIYAGKKEELDPLKKQVDDYGKKIKTEMRNQDLTEFVVDGIKASITITPKSDFNELQAIEILRKNLTPDQFNEVVKTKEYIDDYALESLVYSGGIDASILAPAETPKEPVVTLRLGKAKK